MGLLQIGAVHVPIYPTISKKETEYIVNHCDAKMLIVSDKTLFDKLKPIVDNIEIIDKIYTFNEIEGASSWKEILDLGEANKEKFIGISTKHIYGLLTKLLFRISVLNETNS